MTLTLYNTKTRQKEAFQPLQPDRVKMYVCGPTVYNLVHIGNARPVVVFDTLFRLLNVLYGEVIYARNITDIDDKIMKAAAENGEEIGALAARFTAEFESDMAQLRNLPPSIVPRATDHLPEMIAMTRRLIEKGHAYEAEGHVLFDVNSMSDYGRLSNRSLEDMLDGARVEVAPYKKYAGDFVLWKPSSAAEPGWDSPWGRGRPGWHLECSAMIEKHLGETIDIHGGGRDLIFPHHENELAQSCCAHDGREYVRYWMHNGYINVGGEKMSKSLGNFRTVRELLGKYDGEVIRYALLSAQYRSELDFSQTLLDQAKACLNSFYSALDKVEALEGVDDVDLQNHPFFLALLDDLNTPVALGEMHKVTKLLNKAAQGDKARLKTTLLQAGRLLGLLQRGPDEWFGRVRGRADITLDAVTMGGEGIVGPTPEEIEAKIAERAQAKADKDYARADEIRKALKAQGVVLEDSREGTNWKRER
ncbi:cysteine--tRNA ligase [Exilibacterium tricleocarpae]|uniref:Cysteine--tRNA ligase n=1 Tax=Exilibacterium tricleocarpae TaxID=2591008 RepID=A0A545TLJ6_9GAMM|nr:cysteine--tRNA ligase [Exilibacterium tricleocarpae]TQV78100.1 cysteine--tRNA ligase [Exilibacterium tricleocarpae]